AAAAAAAPQAARGPSSRGPGAGGVRGRATRHDLLALLTHLVACRAVNQIKHEAVQKRGGGQVRGGAGLDELLTPGQSPDEKPILEDLYHHYVNSLPERLRELAELYLAGCTHKEIAAQLGCV